MWYSHTTDEFIYFKFSLFVVHHHSIYTNPKQNMGPKVTIMIKHKPKSKKEKEEEEKGRQRVKEGGRKTGRWKQEGRGWREG